MSVPMLAAAQVAAPLAPLAAKAVTAGAGAAAEKLRNVAQDFEAVLTTELLKQMRQSLEPDQMFGSDGADIYGGLFDFFMGKHMAQAGGLGIADFLQRQIQTQTEAPKAGG